MRHFSSGQTPFRKGKTPFSGRKAYWCFYCSALLLVRRKSDHRAVIRDRGADISQNRLGTDIYYSHDSKQD